MRSFCLGAFCALAVATFAASAADKPTVEIAIAKDQDSKPTTTLTADAPKIYAFFKSKGTHPGDKLRSVWIADDVGTVAPANTKIDEATLSADKDNFYGAFSLSQPTSGWPVGKYHVDIYVGDTLASSAKFTIKAAPQEKESDEESED
ncbi:MAG: hypothetical protein ACJ8KU_06370 [Chthoniobacterales bacterium]